MILLFRESAICAPYIWVVPLYMIYDSASAPSALTYAAAFSFRLPSLQAWYFSLHAARVAASRFFTTKIYDIRHFLDILSRALATRCAIFDTFTILYISFHIRRRQPKRRHAFHAASFFSSLLFSCIYAFAWAKIYRSFLYTFFASIYLYMIFPLHDAAASCLRFIISLAWDDMTYTWCWMPAVIYILFFMRFIVSSSRSRDILI